MRIANLKDRLVLLTADGSAVDFAVPQELPPVFTKYTSSTTGPVGRV